MAYVRLSLVMPKPGQEARAAGLLDELLDHCRRQPGYETGFRLDPFESGRRLGRLTVWEAKHFADAAANSTHDLSLRSELNLTVEPGSLEERAFAATVVDAEVDARAEVDAGADTLA